MGKIIRDAVTGEYYVVSEDAQVSVDDVRAALEKANDTVNALKAILPGEPEQPAVPTENPPAQPEAPTEQPEPEQPAAEQPAPAPVEQPAAEPTIPVLN